MVSIIFFYRTLLFLSIITQLLNSVKAGSTNASNIRVCNQISELMNDPVAVPAAPSLNPAQADSISTPLNRATLLQYMAGSPKDCAKGVEVVLASADFNAFTRNKIILLLRHPRIQISFDTSHHGPHIAGESLAKLDKFIMHIDPAKPGSAHTFGHEASHLMLAFMHQHLTGQRVFPLADSSVDIPHIYAQASKKLSFAKLQQTWKNNLTTLTKAYINEKANQPLTDAEKKMLQGFRKAMEIDPPSTIIEIPLTKVQAKEFNKDQPYPMKLLPFFAAFPNNADMFVILSKQASSDGSGYVAQARIDDPLLAFIVSQHINQQNLAKYKPEAHPEEFLTHTLECESHACIRFLYPNLLEPLEEHMDTLLRTYPELTDNAQPDPKKYLYHDPYIIPNLYGAASNMKTVHDAVVSIVNTQEKASLQELETGISAITQIINKSNGYGNNKKAEAIDRLLLAELLFLKKEPKLAYQQYNIAFELSRDAFKEVPKAAAHFNRVSLEVKGCNAPGHVQRAAKRN